MIYRLFVKPKRNMYIALMAAAHFFVLFNHEVEVNIVWGAHIQKGKSCVGSIFY